MRLLDLFCGAGGAAMGYHRAGFEVVGVDIEPQPNFPFEFTQADALEYVDEHGHEYDVIHASPPCQHYSSTSQRNVRAVASKHPDLVGITRHALLEVGIPYVMENVTQAPMQNGIVLCGSSFGLDVRRHRTFESNLFLWGLPCDHSWQTPRFRSPDSRQDTLATVVGVHGKLNYAGDLELRRKAMGIDWMPSKSLSQAIPPAYTEYIGEQLVSLISKDKVNGRQRC